MITGSIALLGSLFFLPWQAAVPSESCTLSSSAAERGQPVGRAIPGRLATQAVFQTGRGFVR
jgi:hypothetical protein